MIQLSALSIGCLDNRDGRTFCRRGGFREERLICKSPGVFFADFSSKSEVLTRWQSDPVSLRVEQAPDLRELTVPLDGVLDGG